MTYSSGDTTYRIVFESLHKGDLVSNQYEEYGVRISSADPNHPPMIFDTAHPTGGDYDLGTHYQGKALILSEDGDSSDPDDNAGGGTIALDFASPSEVNSFRVIDTEEGGTVKFFAADGSLIRSAELPHTGNGGICEVNFGVEDVSRMEITLNGSGAIDDVCYTIGDTEFDDTPGGPSDSLDGYVEGTAGDDLINENYTGDPEGDRIDNGDAILPGEGPNDDIVYAGGGSDTVYGGQGDDEIYGDSVAPGTDTAGGPTGGTAESFEWSKLPDTDRYGHGTVDDGEHIDGHTFAQDTGSVTVTAKVPHAGWGRAESQFDDDGIFVTGDANPNSALQSMAERGECAKYEFGFSEAVTGVSFTVTDIDVNKGSVTINAYDADGKPVDIDFTPGDELLRDGNTFTADSTDNDTQTDPDASVTVNITGPVSRIEVIHDNVGSGTSGIFISDVAFTAGAEFLPAGPGEPGDDRLFGGDGDDVIYGEDGNDTIDGGTGDDTLYGGEGDDIIRGGDGSDHIEGGAGNDRISGGDGGDFIDGGDGDDYIEGGEDADVIQGGAGNDTILGQGGDDEIDGGDGDDTIIGGRDNDIIRGGAGNDKIDGKSGDDTLYGGSGDDEIIGGGGNDVIYGEDGNDTITGGNNVDIIDGGAGDDTIHGGAMGDKITGGDGNDTVFGGNGDDYIDTSAPLSSKPLPDRGYPGLFPSDPDPDNDKDYVEGGAGNDTIITGDDDDVIFGGTGDDTINAGLDDDYVDGGEGNDTIIAGEGSDEVYGGAGDDTIYGGLGPSVPFDQLNVRDDQGDKVTDNGKDVIHGGDGNDRIFGEDDADELYGDAGDDYIDGGIDDDYIDGGDGNDTLLGGQGDDTIRGGAGDDTIFGGDGNDTIHGNEGNDTIDGGAGDDYIAGNQDDDTIEGGSGNDVIYGQGGNDRLSGGDGDDWIQGGRDDDYIDGGAGNDTLLGGAGADEIHGGDGDDIIDGQGGNDVIYGEGGNDTINGANNEDTIYGGDGDDTIHAGASDDIVYGGADNDTIYGENGDDELYGEDGDDAIDGGKGNDTITGGAGADRLSGGDDRDTFFGGNGGDFVDGGAGGDDFDTLDLTGSDVDFITYTSDDREDGTVTFKDGSSMKFEEIENVIPCFTPGTLIATPQGERPVEELRVGDKVITRDNGIQEIAWAGRKNVDLAGFEADPSLRPVLIRAGSLGHGLPERDMLVSPNHRMLIANEMTSLYFEEHEVLVAAKHLVGAPGIAKADSLGTSYIHFMFEQHEVVLSDGTWTESFQPGDYTLKGIDEAQRAEIFAIFPDLKTSAGRTDYAAARKILKKREASLLVM
ncbi:Hint domain-containing protein [Roseicyclus sp. F158]|uniref:Hint domain-containing protein n=1 Tax=Tropicimonas omnivorans TaxID=3075590 RepID=A0ABU3DK90_9RHOB|nr:Hint domain-containing protein [Roseicyclus sp. F158]MDT0683954.1 Hint domain-containing protein [Roseicyclus sp. F158]